MSPALERAAPAVATQVWGWKMLAILAVASAANMFVQDLSFSPDGTPRLNSLIMLVATVGIAEYAFGRRWTPLPLWRAFSPAYTVLVIYLLAGLLARGAIAADGHQVPFVVVVSATLFLAGTIIALARRARYLGPDRIPFGGQKPSLT